MPSSNVSSTTARPKIVRERREMTFGHVVQGAFDRNRDLLLHFLRGVARDRA